VASATGLKRLAKLYALVEQRNALEVRAASAAVHEAEQAAQTLAARRRVELSAGHAGLVQGSRIEALAVERTRAAYQAHGAHLHQRGEELKAARESSVEQHRASRVERQQLEGVVERARVEKRVAEDRREQGTSDDRFLARRHWTQERELETGASVSRS
jgi:hypothetical protein